MNNDNDLILEYQSKGCKADAALQRLLQTHRPLVVRMAKSFGPREHDLEDLIQEGMYGLVKALDRFDVSRNVQLRTYARWWVRTAILAGVQASHMIHIPREKLFLSAQLHKVESELGDGHDDQVIHLMGISAGELLDLRTMPKANLILDNPMPNSTDTYGDVYVGKDSDPTDQIEVGQMRAALRIALSKASHREQEVFIQWFEGERLQKDIGADYGVSKQRIAQMIAKVSRMAQNTLRADVLSV